MEAIREPAVAGTFYPNDPGTLTELIDNYTQTDGTPVECPKAIVAPHAGYVYSGPIAGKVYAQLAEGRNRIRRVVLLGPSHRVAFKGMAVPTSNAFRTPLGDIPIDSAAINEILSLPNVGFLEQAHTDEHSLEVHLPFLQKVLQTFDLVPIVVGDASKEDVAQVIDKLWGGDETLIVISSDLSHYEPYDVACEIDNRTSQKIVALDSTLSGQEACGCRPLNGLLHYVKLHGLNVETVEVKNSGDTAGSRDRVVGYGAYKVMENEGTALNDIEGDLETLAAEWTLAERQRMLQVAREAIRSPLEGEKNYNIDLARFSDRLKQERATFITLNIDGRLRGCIGSLVAHRPLILDVAHNAQAAAFKDPRFSSLSHDEYELVDMHISVLSQPQPLKVASREELIEKLRPGIDGLIIKEGSFQATYLPSVWDQLPDTEQFVTELRRKAGLDPEGWSDHTEVLTYTTEEFS